MPAAIPPYMANYRRPQDESQTWGQAHGNGAGGYGWTPPPGGSSAPPTSGVATQPRLPRLTPLPAPRARGPGVNEAAPGRGRDSMGRDLEALNWGRERMTAETPGARNPSARNPGAPETVSPASPFPRLTPLPGGDTGRHTGATNQATSDTHARGAIDGLGRRIELPGSRRVGMGAAPERVGGVAGLGTADQTAGAYQGLGPAPSRERADGLGERAAAGFDRERFARAELGDETDSNEFEQLGLEALRSGGDPGAGQFQGRELSDTVFSEAQINQMAQRNAAPTIAAFKTAQRMAERAGSAGGGMDPARIANMQAQAALGNAGAKAAAYRDATLDATQMNAEQAARAAANTRDNFGADLSARLGLGKMSLDRAATATSAGMARRGLDQSRDIAGFEGEIAQRDTDIGADLREGEIDQEGILRALDADIALRDQDMDYSAEGGRQGLTARGQTLDFAAEGGRQALDARGQDVTQRGQDIGRQEAEYQGGIQQRAQDLQRQYQEAGLNAEQAQARVQAELGLRGQSIDEGLGRGRLENERRGQDVAMRGQSIEERLGLGRLGNERRGQDIDLAQGTAERQNRLEMLDRQLADGNLDRQMRMSLEQERNNLQRELATMENRQRESEFSRRIGLDERQQGAQEEQFGQNFGEGRRRFDSQQEFEREQGRTDRNYDRERRGEFEPPPAPTFHSQWDALKTPATRMREELEREEATLRLLERMQAGR